MAFSDPLITVKLSELQALLGLPEKVTKLETENRLLSDRYNALYNRYIEVLEAVDQLRHEI